MQPRGETSRVFPSRGPRENQWGIRASLPWLARDNFPYLLQIPCSGMSHRELEMCPNGTISSTENERTLQMRAFVFLCLSGSGVTSTLVEATNAKCRTRLVRLSRLGLLPHPSYHLHFVLCMLALPHRADCDLLKAESQGLS